MQPLTRAMGKLDLKPLLPAPLCNLEEKLKVNIASFAANVFLLSVGTVFNREGIKKAIFQGSVKYLTREIHQHSQDLQEFLDSIPEKTKKACTKLSWDGSCYGREVTDVQLIVKTFPHLAAFTIGFCTSDAQLYWISQLSQLRVLEINTLFCLNVTEEGVAHLAKLSNLERFSIAVANVSFGDTILRTLGSCTKLSSIRISNCPSITAKGIASIIHLPIEELHFEGSSIDDACLNIMYSMFSLHSLNLKWCTGYTAQGLLGFKEKLKQFEHDGE